MSTKGFRKFTVEELKDGTVEVTYEKDPALKPGEIVKLKSRSLLFLAQHDEHFKQVIIGNCEAIARLIFGVYNHAVREAGRGDVELGHLAEMLGKVSEDITRIEEMYRKAELTPEEIIEKLHLREIRDA
jgi:hypothetical protein